MENNIEVNILMRKQKRMPLFEGIDPEIVSTYRKSQDKKYVDLKGTVCRSHHDLAVLAQIFRDSRYEIFRIVYCKNGVVVSYDSFSSRMPNTVYWFAKKSKKSSLRRETFKINRKIERLGADTMYFIHNHPSGNVESSKEDREFTKIMMKEFPDIFGGHIIIDHNKYNLVSGTKDNIIRLNDFDYEDYMVEEDAVYPAGEKIDNSSTMRKVAKKAINQFEDAVVLILDSSYIVTLVGTIHRSWFREKNVKTIIGIVGKWAKKSAGIFSIIVYNGNKATLKEEESATIASLWYTGRFFDIIIFDGKNEVSLRDDYGHRVSKGEFFKDTDVKKSIRLN